jgi:hypothetical protein
LLIFSVWGLGRNLCVLSLFIKAMKTEIPLQQEALECSNC